MSRVSFLFRITERYLRGRRTSPQDLAQDYDRAAGTYAETWQAFMAPVTDRFLSHLAPPAGARILDLGCGTGRTLGYAQAIGFTGHYCGIDLSPEMLARLPEGPSIETHCGDVHELLPALPAASFDIATALWSWEYLDRKTVLQELARVLRPGGRIVLLANRRDTIPELEQAFLRLMAEQPRRIRKVFPMALRMPRSSDQMRRELARSGFTPVHAEAGECIRRHDSAEAAVAWGFQTGALAGTRCVLDLPDLEARLARCYAAGFQPGMPFTTTHRFVGGVGERPC